MHSLRVLIHQARPFHQIFLHQAFNAQGVFHVCVSDDLCDTRAWLGREQGVDVLVLDHRMPEPCARSLFQCLHKGGAPRALLFVGGVGERSLDLAQDARTQGFRVVGELPWPMSTVALQQALAQL
ncbi:MULTISPECIES: histidine kinase [Pseudomonas]|uniref:Histidine kinase n=1 Tax=Pseudomonas mosselii TaxID=78327 RepID=A0A5R8ZBT2_9PSED|nr:histidine kinase [Pseudomonas mosselii]TLP63259.1 histidine kinase [Pseudomonas mosselii]